MSAPLLLGYKATWVKEAPFPGSGGYLSSSSTSDAYTPENIEFYAGLGDVVKDIWAIYQSPDRQTLVTVNLDGTLRSSMLVFDPSVPLTPHLHWANGQAAVK
jgi:hypothetical protein